MITDEMKAYAQSLLAINPLYQNITQDIGVLAVMDSLAFKLDEKLRDYTNVVAEYYSPESEAVLLSHLLYKIGYIKFKKPMIITAKIKNETDIVFPKDEVFTDGISSFLVTNSVSCIAKTKTDIEFMQSSIKTYQKTVGTGLYLHIETGVYYRDIYKIDVSRSNAPLSHSQQFIKNESDVSYEVKPDATIDIVIRLNNTNGSNIITNDIITTKVYVSKDITDPPDALSVVTTGYDSVITDIIKKENYTPSLSKEDMRDILRYNKNIANSMTFNEDYYQLVQASPIRGISGLKVWQQREQELEQHGDTCWINKVWFSFTLDAESPTNRKAIEEAITSLVYSTTEGKYPIYVLPDIVPLVVTLNIINNISKKIPIEVQNKIIDDLKGIYDDKYKKISKTIAYKSVFTNLQHYNTDIDLTMTEKGDFKNSKFYKVTDVNITITERGY